MSLTIDEFITLYEAYENTEGTNWEDKPGAVEANEGRFLICDSGDWGGHILDGNTRFIAVAHRYMPILLEMVDVALRANLGKPKQKKWWVARFVHGSDRLAAAFFQHFPPTAVQAQAFTETFFEARGPISEFGTVGGTAVTEADGVDRKAIDSAGRGKGPVVFGKARVKKKTPKPVIPYRSMTVRGHNDEELLVETDGKDVWISNCDGVLISTQGASCDVFTQEVMRRCGAAAADSFNAFKPK